MKKLNLLINEEIKRVREIMGLNEGLDDRVSAAEVTQSNTDNVDTLFKLMSKYTPKDYWFVTVGYLNNVNPNVKVQPSKELEDLGIKTQSDYIKGLIDSDDWKSGKMKHPLASRTVNKEKIPSTIYKMKTFACQWLSEKARNTMKADRDSRIMATYKKYDLEPPTVDLDDKRGLGWTNISDTPFDKHDVTGTQRFVIYRKKNCYTDSPSTYFIKMGETIKKITPTEVDFFLRMSNTDNSTKMSNRLQQIENEKLREELFAIENLYDFKNINLEKIPFLTCTCVIDGKPVKISYINKNAAPDGVSPGDFAEFIQEFIDSKI
jgi:hypothetical protein